MGLRTWRRLAMLVLGLGLTLGLGYGIRWLVAPSPPSLRPDEADAAVLTVLEEACKDVWWHPHSARAWGYLGQQLWAHSHYPEAETCFARAAALDPAEPRWPYLQAFPHLVDDPPRALPLLRRAAALCQGEPDMPAVRLAELLLQQGILDEAGQQFRQILERDPNHARAHLGQARVEFEANQLEKARKHLEACAQDRHTQQAAAALLAQLALTRGDTEEAARQRTRLAEMPGDAPWHDPYFEEIRSLMAGKQARLARLQILRRQGRLDEATQLAIQLQETYPDVYWLIEGREQLHRGNLRGAETAFRKAIELDPNSIDAFFDLGTLLMRREDWDRAAETFQRILEQEPGHGPAQRHRGECFLKKGDRPRAIQALQAAQALMPHDEETRARLAEATGGR